MLYCMASILFYSVHRSSKGVLSIFLDDIPEEDGIKDRDIYHDREQRALC